MMSERITTIEKTISISVGWTDVFSCATELLDKTQPSDVRWVHVERAKAIYEGIKALFDAKAYQSNADAHGQALANTAMVCE
jgi:hypothetical protein